MSVPTITELRVTGMTCNNCARAVTEAVQQVAGVHSATVTLSSQHASVRWNSPAAKNSDAVLAAISQAGFAAKEISSDDMAASQQSHWQWNLILGLAVTGTLMIGEWAFGLAMTPWFQWLAFALAGVVQIFCGAQFYLGAWRQAKVGQSNMDTLVALGSTTAFGYSTWALLSGAGGHVFFMEAAAIISLVSTGHWLEARVSDHASGALRSLLNLAPATARKIVSNTGKPKSAFDIRNSSFKNSPPAETSEIEVPVADLNINDRIVLRPGDRVPVDGVVLEGESAVDEAMLTGESVPADKKSDDKLFAGTVNLNGRLVMRVIATGEATALAHIIAAVQRAQTSRADIQRLGDRISNVFVPVIVVISLAAGVWWGFAPASAARVHDFLAQFLWHAHAPVGAAAGFIIAAAVLIVACPCAMGLATPAAIMASANSAARRGILIRDGVALEKAGNVTAVVLDKTGTLTSGELGMCGPWTPDASNESIQQAQRIAAALARQSNHPVSKVLAWLCKEPVPMQNWKEIPGSGVQAQLISEQGDQVMIRLGSVAWLHTCGIKVPNNDKLVEQWKDEGATLVGLAKGNDLIGVFALRDFLKPNAAKVVWQLQRQGLKTFLLTGDNSRTALAIAKEVGIPPENVFAEVRPEQKAEFVKKLQAQGERVAFVGDGINDAPALTQADLGIAVSRASDIAREAADIILLKSEIEAVPEALGLARATLRTIKQNLFWAFFYNSLGVPLAALGFISPIFCAAAMGFSDLIVIGNALRLLRWRQK
ncbi:MAG TPA: cation-translocating P-type ATPase [Verrucomicrobiae bacterium]|nr:cation-translocating P-type ATPase [Verrucomicrobiae bacterium]